MNWIALIILIFVLNFPQTSFATDTINVSQSIRDGETLVSSDGTYELGFFSPGNSRNRYVGMWYKNIPVRTYIWVANREVPITNNTGIVLRVVKPGLLVILNHTNGIIWSSNTSKSVQNPIAQLLDSGNFVVRDANDENRPESFLWQSFEHPTDTLFFEMKIGWNLATGSESYLSSWRSEDDPAPGDYSFRLDLTGTPQVFIKRGANATHRAGPWNGFLYSGSRLGGPFPKHFMMNENEVYTWTTSNRPDIVSRYTINQSGFAQRLNWVDRQGWVVYLNIPKDTCDYYGLCGEHGRCDLGSDPSCLCLDRFVPRDPQAWVQGDWTYGCKRRSNLSCNGDVFLRYSAIKLPDARNSSYNMNMTLEECRVECLSNCSCSAYAQLDIKSGTGCIMWYNNLNDIRSLPTGLSQDVYIRMASSETESHGRNREVLIEGLTSGVALVLVGLTLLLYFRKRKINAESVKHGLHDGEHARDLELPLFDLSVISKATDHFSMENKLGEGGFGAVYKGRLEGGQEIAVKRLSKDSKQGLDELKNELTLIANLQHRNLVRLLGCCIQAEENMLIYEYMPNKSLDGILFDPVSSMLLDWQKRFHIINGIARGLMYLHQDSRLRIIHRDLKASNVLLDSNMNPKISDFGIARSFGGNETTAKTNRVVGTFGYMSPEYAVKGLFSAKSDVFSFGVLVLEIVSGKQNRSFSYCNHSLNLIGHAWTLYKEGRSLELVDASLGISQNFYSEILRSIHVGLLCVQQNPEDRPTMSSVILMLGNEGVLPEAKQPGFFTLGDVSIVQNLPSVSGADSINGVTITMLEPR